MFNVIGKGKGQNKIQKQYTLFLFMNFVRYSFNKYAINKSNKYAINRKIRNQSKHMQSVDKILNQSEKQNKKICNQSKENEEILDIQSKEYINNLQIENWGPRPPWALWSPILKYIHQIYK